MKVVTLTEDVFKNCCRQLADIIYEDGFSYDCMIGIANGGVYVAREMAGGAGVPLYYVKLQRRTTGLKNKVLRKIICKLPLIMSNRLRIIESHVLGCISCLSGHKTKKVEITTELKDAICNGAKNVLLVDDAVDSGQTLQSVKAAIEGICPHITVRTAVITVTRENALGLADYRLFQDCTIVRFPWSLDA